MLVSCFASVLCKSFGLPVTLEMDSNRARAALPLSVSSVSQVLFVTTGIRPTRVTSSSSLPSGPLSRSTSPSSAPVSPPSAVSSSASSPSCPSAALTGTTPKRPLSKETESSASEPSPAQSPKRHITGTFPSSRALSPCRGSTKSSTPSSLREHVEVDQQTLAMLCACPHSRSLTVVARLLMVGRRLI